jgi:hypothetical protein
MADPQLEVLAEVAFEVDAADEATRTGWSVVVRGALAEVTDDLPFTWWG